jgi:hypothetical protein
MNKFVKYMQLAKHENIASPGEVCMMYFASQVTDRQSQM